MEDKNLTFAGGEGIGIHLDNLTIHCENCRSLTELPDSERYKCYVCNKYFK